MFPTPKGYISIPDAVGRMRSRDQQIPPHPAKVAPARSWPAQDADRKDSRIRKQRDGAAGDTFTFKLDPVEIYMDEDEKWISSCVVVAAEASPMDRGPKLSAKQRIALDKLRDTIIDAGKPAPEVRAFPSGIQVVPVTLWRDYLEKAGVINSDGNPREQFRRIKDRLLEAKAIGIWDEQIWCVPPSHS